MGHIDCQWCGRTHRGWRARDRARGARCGRGGWGPFPGESTGTIGGFHLHSVREGDTLWLELYGELDLATVPALDRELRRAAPCGVTRVVVDLSGLEFIDSSGLHALLSARDGGAGGCALELTRGSAAVQRLFDLTGCTDLFRFLD